jgi:hypothetical protein
LEEKLDRCSGEGGPNERGVKAKYWDTGNVTRERMWLFLARQCRHNSQGDTNIFLLGKRMEHPNSIPRHGTCRHEKKTTNEKRKSIVPASVSKVRQKEMKPMTDDASLITPIAAINLQGCLSSDPNSQDPEAVSSNIHEPMNLSTGGFRGEVKQTWLIAQDP